MIKHRLDFRRFQAESLACQASRPLARRLPGMADHLHQQGNHLLGIGQGLGRPLRGGLGFPLLELLLVWRGLREKIHRGSRDPRALQAALADQVRERRLDVLDVQTFLEFADRHSAGAEFNLADDRIGKRSPLAEANIAIGPQSLFVKLGHAAERVVLGIVVVAGEVALLAKYPPGGHGGTAAGFEKFSLGEDLFSGEGLEQVAGSETCGSHEGLNGYGILITYVYEICY